MILVAMVTYTMVKETPRGIFFLVMVYLPECSLYGCNDFIVIRIVLLILPLKSPFGGSQKVLYLIIIWLLGSLSGPYFGIRTAKKDRSRLRSVQRKPFGVQQKSLRCRLTKNLFWKNFWSLPRK